uniref:3'-5' exonuclease n=1 Tax=Rhodnius prolixus TaxID=13249 RepID=T1HNZ6_RHOPR
MENTKEKELKLPAWLVKQVNENRHKLGTTEKKPFKNSLFKTNGHIIKKSSEFGKVNNIENGTKVKPVIGKTEKDKKDNNLPLCNFITLHECAVQCEKILNLAELSEELIIGLELDWPSQFKAVISKTSSFHICYGKNLCALFEVGFLNKLPLAFTHLIQHPKVKLVGHNIINDLNKIARDFNFDTKTIIKDNLLKNPENVDLYCEHAWTFKTNLETREIPLDPTTNDNLELKFKGKIYYTSNFVECASFCEQLLNLANSSDELVLGFDQEWPLTRSGWGKVALMQICPNENECYIFHISSLTSLPKVLIYLLKHCKVKLTGLNIKNDIRKLGKDFKLDVFSILNNNIVELCTLANETLHCYERWSLQRLVLNQKK